MGWGGLTGAPLRAADPPARAGGRGNALPPDTAALLSPFQLMARARAALVAGDLGLADSFARRVLQSDATSWRQEDSPRKLLDDIAKARQDPKALLTASRAALRRGSLAEAESFAREADERGSLWTFGLLGDSPDKALRDIEAARRKQNPATGTASRPTPGHGASEATQPVRTVSATPEDTRLGFLSGRPQPADAKTRDPRPAGKKPEQPADPREAAESLVTQGRQCLAEGKLDEALDCAQKAGAIGQVRWGLFEDTPQKLLDDVREATARRDKDDATRCLAHAHKLLQAGHLDAAEREAHRAAKLHGPYTWRDRGERPEDLIRQIQAARAKSRPAPSLARKEKEKETHTSEDPSFVTISKAAHSPGRRPQERAAKQPEKKGESAPSAHDATAQRRALPNPATAKKETPASPKAERKPSGPPPQVVSGMEDMGEPWPRTPADKASGGPAPQVVKAPRDAGGPVPPPMKHKTGGPDPRVVKSPRDAGDPAPTPPGRKVDGPAPQVVKAPRDAGGPVPPPGHNKTDGPAPQIVKGPPDMGGKPAPRVSAREHAMNLVRQGRTEMAAGKLAEAMKTAQKAQGVTGVRWGLFEDNPEKLLRDVREAITRRDKEESVRVLAGARKLYEEGHLDAAEREAHRAAKLHGPYTWWDLGDRPQSLIDEIRTARSEKRTVKLPPPPTGKAPAVVKNDGAGTPPAPGPDASSPVQPPKAAPAEDANVARARALVAEARKLHKEGKLVEARARVVEAYRLRVTFAPGEDSPGLVYQQLAADARTAIDRALGQAQQCLASGPGDARERYHQAEQVLLKGREMAEAFGHDTHRVDDRLSRVRALIARAEQPKAEEVASAAPLPGPLPAPLPPLPGMTAEPGPAMPPAVRTAQEAPPAPRGPGVSPGAAHPAPGAPGMTQGQALIAQARTELGKGELGTARRLAVEASKKEYGVYPVAVALLRTIDAEEQRQQAYRTLKTFDAAWSAYVRKDYRNAYNLMSTVNPDLLDEARQGKMREVMNTPEMQPRAVAQAPAEGKPDEGATRQVVHEGEEKPDAVGRARAEDGGAGDSPSDALLRSTQARRNVLFQKLHREGLEAQRQAAAKFRTGQTDEALDLLQDFLSRLGDESLDASQVALLRRPVESRLKRYRLLKAQQDMRTQTSVAAKTQQDAVRRTALQAQQKSENVARLMNQYNELYKAAKYDQAHSLALQAKELDPDNQLITTAVILSERQRNLQEYQDIKDKSAEVFRKGLNAAEDLGSPEAVEDNIAFDPEHWERVKNRKPLQATTTFRKMEKEREIEGRLTRPVSLSFTDTPLNRVINDLHALTGINFHIDSPALREEGISLEQPVSLNLDQISLKSALNLMLHTAQLTYVIKDEVILITTEAHAQGQLTPATYQVADLVIPIHDFANIRNPSAPPTPGMPTGQPLPGGGNSYLPGGVSTGSPSGSMLDQASPFASGSTGGTIQVQKRGPSETMEETLIKLITSTVAPRSWTNMGGPGTIDYFPHTMALVINQSADIQEQIQDLLASLRRLQDQEVAVEVRFITINENFYERIGVKFSANILTDDVTQRFEPQIISGNFKPAGFINQFSPDRFLAGITPAGTFTGTLDIPINVQTFEQAIPPFGGYPNIPGAGGLALGLAFLSDIQVFLFMEAVQGDQRNNIMQAPKLTLFNGQTSTISAFDSQPFVTTVSVTPVAGTFVYQPTVSQLPIGVFLTIQAIISADRRFVRMSLTPTLTNLASGVVPLFPIVTPIFPLIDGTSTGQPIVFTQYIQQPISTTLSVLTTVSVPDGGTVLLGGLKRLSEGRNEFGPPILSKIPYVSRLFRNVGYGREASSLLMMVTPRIIIQEEEEERMTGVRRLPAVNF